MNKPTRETEAEAVIKNLSKNKRPGPDVFTGEFHQPFRQKLIPILVKPFLKFAEEKALPNSFYETKITLMPIPDIDVTKKKKKKIIGQYH